MKNILAIDYGKKRWGLAFCDELRVVFTLPAAVQLAEKERFTHLESLLKSRKVDTLLVGLPLSLEGQKTPMTEEVEKFIEVLKKYNLPIKTIDEALSSYSAAESLPKKSLKKGLPKRDGSVDSKAAALILEDFLGQNP